MLWWTVTFSVGRHILQIDTIYFKIKMCASLWKGFADSLYNGKYRKGRRTQSRTQHKQRDLALPAEQLSVHCMTVLCPRGMHETRQKTNTLSKQIAPQHLLLLLKREWKEPPACEQVLVTILTERITTHTPSSLQRTKAKWNMRWEGFKTSAEKEGNEQTLPAQCFVYFKRNQTTEIKLFVQISMVQFVSNWLMNLW